MILNIASISTVKPRGKELTPTAARAWTPVSPKISFIIFEQPLITKGCCVKLSIQFTKPVSFINWSTLLIDPISFFKADKIANPHSLAWFWAVSKSTSAPTFPFAKDPSSSNGPWPDIYAILSTITQGL